MKKNNRASVNALSKSLKEASAESELSSMPDESKHFRTKLKKGGTYLDKHATEVHMAQDDEDWFALEAKIATAVERMAAPMERR